VQLTRDLRVLRIILSPAAKADRPAPGSGNAPSNGTFRMQGPWWSWPPPPPALERQGFPGPRRQRRSSHRQARQL